MIIVEKIQTSTADAIGHNPLKIIGVSIVKIKTTVDTIETRLKIPFFLPIMSKSMQKTAAKPMIALSL